MSIAELYVGQVATVAESATTAEAARLMRDKHVGDLVVVNRAGDREIPVGMVTDRDIITSVIAGGKDAKEVLVAEVMSADLVTVEQDTSYSRAVRKMRDHGVQRLPVVDRKGFLVGILSAHDLLEELATDLMGLAKLSDRQLVREGTRKELSEKSAPASA